MGLFEKFHNLFSAAPDDDAIYDGEMDNGVPEGYGVLAKINYNQNFGGNVYAVI